MKKALIITAGVATIGFIIYRYIKVQTGLLKDFSYKIIGFHLYSFQKDKISFTLKIRFTNQSNIEATVRQVYSDVYIDGKLIGYIMEAKEFIIPANGSSDIDLYFSVAPQFVLTNVVGLLTGILQKKDATLTLKGNAKVTSSFITTVIPIDYSTTVKQYF